MGGVLLTPRLFFSRYVIENHKMKRYDECHDAALKFIQRVAHSRAFEKATQI